MTGIRPSADAKFVAMVLARITLGELVAERGTKLRLRAGDAIFREGDESTNVYACISGRTKIFVTSPSGREFLLAVKTAGQFFGELSAIDGRPRSASAVAAEPSVVAQLTAHEFIDALEEVPGLAVGVLRGVADQVRIATFRAVSRDSDSTAVRTGNLLLELGQAAHRHSPETVEIVLPIGQDELAAWVGATREATARSLAIFRRAGALSTGRQKITLHGLDTLAKVVSTNP